MKKLQLLLCVFVSLCLCVKTDAAPRFAALHDGTLTAAPSMFWPNPAPPTEAEYNARGFYRVVDTPPTTPAPEGYHYEPQGWELVVVDSSSPREDVNDSILQLGLPTTTIIRRIYEAVENPPPPPKTYQTADIIEALMAHEVWPQCRAWIEEQGLLDLVFTTPTFADDLPNFVAARQGLKQLLGWTDEQVEALLEEASSESSEVVQ